MRYLTTVRGGLARSRRAVGGALALATAAFVVFAAPAPAMAAEDWYKGCNDGETACQTGVQVGAGEGECHSTPYGNTTVCVDYYGDYVYVKDGKTDGNSAIGAVSAYEGSYSFRYCRNPYGSGTWARCNFDWIEGAYKEAWAGYRESTPLLHLQKLWGFYG
ncbi:hypothetical protein [Micromonospora sp. NPDC007230]|uniref:hypothetical protein n=1 Tax=Micromonospora sp. NPDC007230 TaxID=3364237 RepID=UPI003698C520